MPSTTTTVRRDGGSGETAAIGAARSDRSGVGSAIGAAVAHMMRVDRRHCAQAVYRRAVSECGRRGDGRRADGRRSHCCCFMTRCRLAPLRANPKNIFAMRGISISFAYARAHLPTIAELHRRRGDRQPVGRRAELADHPAGRQSAGEGAGARPGGSAAAARFRSRAPHRSRRGRPGPGTAGARGDGRSAGCGRGVSGATSAACAWAPGPRPASICCLRSWRG